MDTIIIWISIIGIIVVGIAGMLWFGYKSGQRKAVEEVKKQTDEKVKKIVEEAKKTDNTVFTGDDINKWL